MGGSGNDSLYGEAGYDYLYGQWGNDLLSGGDGDDDLYGGNNNDTVYGNGGNDWIYEDATNDSGQDVLAGGAGADTLQGGTESDTYLFTFNSDGQDVIYDAQGSYDTLRVNGVTVSGIGITRSGNDVYVYTRADASDGVLNEYVRVVNYYSGSAPAAGQIEYLDVSGTVLWFSSNVSTSWQF